MASMTGFTRQNVHYRLLAIYGAKPVMDAI